MGVHVHVCGQIESPVKTCDFGNALSPLVRQYSCSRAGPFFHFRPANYAMATCMAELLQQALLRKYPEALLSIRTESHPPATIVEHGPAKVKLLQSNLDLSFEQVGILSPEGFETPCLRLAWSSQLLAT